MTVIMFRMMGRRRLRRLVDLLLRPAGPVRDYGFA